MIVNILDHIKIGYHINLLINKAFARFWLAQTTSGLGSAVSSIALPLVAVTTLEAGAREMGYIAAIRNLPVLTFGLFMGVWVDRMKRLRLFTLSTVAQGLILLAIPIGAVTGQLRIEWLYAVTLVAGFLSSLSILASTSFVPSIVEKDQLVLGNSRLQVAGQVVAVGGQGLGGILVEILTAPFALIVDAVSYLISAVLVTTIKVEDNNSATKEGASIWREIGEGIRTVFQHPLLRTLVIGTMLGSFAASIQSTLLILYATRELGLDPVWIGGTLASSSLAGLLGALVARSLSDRFGPGRALAGAMGIEGLGIVLLPFMSVSWGTFLIPGLVLSQGLIVLGWSIYSVIQISIRQAITPDHLLGRVHATRRVIVFGVIPIGALLAGYVGETYGLRMALAVSAVAMGMTAVYFAVSPLRNVRSLEDT